MLTGRSFTVGLITNDSFGRFSIPVMLGAEDALQTGQIAVLLCDGRDDAIREQHYVRTLLARRVDGIIVTGRRTDPRPPLSAGFPVPIVYAMSEPANPEDASVLPDDEGGGRVRQAPDVDAIFCGSDQIARGVSEALRELGRRVPDDVALVGFDNWTVIAEASRPPLTTIDMNLTEVGRTAARLLLAAIDGHTAHGTHLVPCQLVAREPTRA